MQRIVDHSEATAGYAPALLLEDQMPAASGWHPSDAPGLVAPALLRIGATTMGKDARRWLQFRLRLVLPKKSQSNMIKNALTSHLSVV